METKQVIVIRKDLNMRKGKMIAQGCHASLEVFRKYIKKNTEGKYEFTPTEDMIDWFDNDYTKICVSVDSESDLIKVYAIAAATGLPASLIKDLGKTEFKEATYTAVAIGPAESSRIDEITGKLKLL